MATNYDQIVREYFDGRSGYTILLSDEPSFYKLLRGTLYKILAIRRDCLSYFQEQAPALSEIKDKAGEGVPVLVFVERILKGRPSADFILTVRKLFPDVKLVVLTGEIGEDELIYLHEIGANNIITKPVSVDSLVQKLAFTIKPQGKLNQLVQVGKELLRKGDLEKVMLVSAKILEIKPDSPAALMLLGDALSGLGRRDEALKAFMKAHEQSTVFMEPIKKLAEFYKDSDDNQYLLYLKKLDKISPLNTERKCEIGRVHLEREELDDAEVFFDQAVKCAVKEAHSYLSQVMSGIAESLFEVSPSMAEKYYSKLLSVKSANLTSEDLETYNRLGIAMRKQGKWENAVANYKEALRVAPKEAGLYYNIGMAYTDGKEYAKCAQSFKRALNSGQDIHKSSAAVARNIAGIFLKVGMTDDARIIIEEGLTVFPNDSGLKTLLKKAVS
ncbi:Tetratricopeptide repeat-containing protein [Maridesulfovibrio ferrireducens]|uniref:Tetratricopeptide repeat-containing protein n=1 Tax=Maridesulfovibrio ferrireducens TaxID=246191 RepID=A0A1G9D6Z2_9BACT|nr:tetratricopeptide repeat protein [Maridesulfovibrio ferrireducens]SDK59465.1 Tetratricopeptide repeat-containing protein [Maridesulfovibrio ferrireducens]